MRSWRAALPGACHPGIGLLLPAHAVGAGHAAASSSHVPSGDPAAGEHEQRDPLWPSIPGPSIAAPFPGREQRGGPAVLLYPSVGEGQAVSTGLAVWLCHTGASRLGTGSARGQAGASGPPGRKTAATPSSTGTGTAHAIGQACIAHCVRRVLRCRRPCPSGHRLLAQPAQGLGPKAPALAGTVPSSDARTP